MPSASEFYRRQPGVGWLVALIAVPVLLALIGWGAASRPSDDAVPSALSVDPSAALTVPSAPQASTPNPPAAVRYGAMSIVRNANGFAVTGEAPDESAKASLPQLLRQAMPGAQIVDDLVVTPGVTGPDIAGLGGLFGAALDTPDFSSTLVGDTVTLTGSAPSETVKADAAASAEATWPNIKVVNDIRVVPAAATPAAPAPAPSPPGPPSGRGCSALQAEISAALRTPITFATDGSTLTPDSQRVVAQIAGKVRACPAARLAITGYTDDSGSDRVNVPLSAGRAKSVADALVSAGVAASNVTSNGAGSAKPVAGNDTPQGRAQNRRVEITVS